MIAGRLVRGYRHVGLWFDVPETITLRDVRSHKKRHIMSVRAGAAYILDPNIGRAMVLQVQQICRLAGNVDDAAPMVGTAIVNTHDERRTVFKIGHPHVAGQREGGMRGGKVIPVVNFAVCSQATMKR
ncbi:hypothetical protein ATY29_32045 [Rhizobium hidalgonense]|nr:hypothetical protein ATY29_32045 [Rhizobium hidalgonense]